MRTFLGTLWRQPPVSTRNTLHTKMEDGGGIVINSFSNCSSPLLIYFQIRQQHRRRRGFGFALAEYLDSASAAALRGFGFFGMELSALVCICIRGVNSANYLDSALTAKYLNVWIWLWRLCVDLASADCGFGLGV